MVNDFHRYCHYLRCAYLDKVGAGQNVFGQENGGVTFWLEPVEATALELQILSFEKQKDSFKDGIAQYYMLCSKPPESVKVIQEFNDGVVVTRFVDKDYAPHTERFFP